MAGTVLIRKSTRSNFRFVSPPAFSPLPFSARAPISGMHYVRTMSGETLAEQLNPSFRKISFSDESAVRTVAFLLREAWTASPPEQANAESLGPWLSACSRKTPEERAATPRSKDFTLHTMWRDSVYAMFNHVFSDVHRWLQEACMLEGDFKPPSHDAFALPFPAAPSSSSAATTEFEKVWDVAVYMIPTYIAKGATVRAYRMEDRYGS